MNPRLGSWDPRQGMNPRLGSWDPRESGIPGPGGNESQTRFRENESHTGVWDGDDDENWDGDDDEDCYRSKNGIKLTDDHRTDTSRRRTDL